VVEAAGLRCVASIDALPDDRSIIVSSLPDDAALLAVAGSLADAGRAVGWIDTSTVSLDASRQAAARSASAGIEHLRAPVSGNAAMAQAAALTVFASGPRTLYDTALPLLRCWGPRQFHLGLDDEARVMKLVVNLLVAHTTAMLAEALVLGQKGGLAWNDLWDAIGTSAVASPLVLAKAPPLRARDYAATFTVQQMRKDLRLILDAGRQLGLSLPLTQRVAAGQAAADAAGWGASDYAAVIEHAEREAGLR
jgi:3-hydroxyisobutyrate dehydrogenase